MLSDETHTALRTLQRGARAVDFETLVPLIERAFGRPLSELFESIDRTAIAAASIGQTTLDDAAP